MPSCVEEINISSSFLTKIHESLSEGETQIGGLAAKQISTALGLNLSPYKQRTNFNLEPFLARIK